MASGEPSPWVLPPRAPGWPSRREPCEIWIRWLVRFRLRVGKPWPFRPTCWICPRFRGVVGLAEEELGSLDILVNNAGLGSSSDPKPVIDFDDRFWDRSLALNLTVPYLLCKAVLPSMIKRKGGRIINIASLASRTPQIHGVAYAASKHGLLGLTRTLALEVAKDGITVNAICPGPVQTEMNDRRIQYDSGRLGIEFSELEARLTPIGRRLQPPEMVPMAILLASDESAAITGQALQYLRRHGHVLRKSPATDVPGVPGNAGLNGSPAALGGDHSGESLTRVFPRWRPSSISMNAPGAFSMPSTTCSRLRSLPAPSQS